MAIMNAIHAQAVFAAVFFWRYIRLTINIAAYNFYSPAEHPSNPRYTSRDCSVIVPTIDPDNPRFADCIRSVLINHPHTVHVVTAGHGRHGHELFDKVKKVVGDIQSTMSTTSVVVVNLIQAPNKRHQVAHAMRKVNTDITVLLDDSVTWGSQFLPSMLLAFQDDNVAFVGTKKRVIPVETNKTGLARFWAMGWQFLGAIYLERHNFEVQATNTVDGSVFVISGRTSAIRTEIVNTSDFLSFFENERFFFGLCGPLNPDDDNAISKYF
jgi:cellulose synthase/poly-beta-1,6-N-acetylglucosamine synthase-like glycosyltransferase